jgi:hypothetical protein
MTDSRAALLVRRGMVREIRALTAIVRREALEAGLAYQHDPSPGLADLCATAFAAEDRIWLLATYLSDETFDWSERRAVVPYADVHATGRERP